MTARPLGGLATARHAFTMDYCADPGVRRNARMSLIDGMLFAVMAGLVPPFAALFAIDLGATDYMLGLLTSLPALVMMVSHVPGAVLTDAFPRRLAATWWFALFHRVFFAAFAALAVAPLPDPVRAWTFILLYALMHLPATVCGVAWTALMGDLFPAEVRGRFFGDRNMLCGAVTMVATALGGVFLDAVPYPHNWAWLFGLSFASVMGSLYYLARMEEPPRPARAGGAAGRAASWATLRRALADPGFAAFTAGMFVFHLGWNLPATLWTILFVRILGLPAFWIGLFATVFTAASVATYPVWGRLSDRRGDGSVTRWGVWLFTPVPLVYIFLEAPALIALFQVLVGAAGAAVTLGIFNRLLAASGDDRPAYVGVFHGLMSATGFITPVIGVWVYQQWGMTAALVASTAVRAAGALILEWSFAAREGRPATALLPHADPPPRGTATG